MIHSVIHTMPGRGLRIIIHCFKTTSSPFVDKDLETICSEDDFEMITLPLLLNFEHSKLACDKFGGGKLTELVDPANLSNVNFERIYGENYKVANFYF